jgi:hypothetical protein
MTVKELLNVVPDGASIRFSDVENKPIYDGVVRNAEELLQHGDLAKKTVGMLFAYNDKLVVVVM